MSKRTVAVVTAASIVSAAVALGTALAWQAAKSAHQPGVHEPLPLAMVCEQQIVYDESCSYDMPKELGGPTTSHCTFALDCCGAVVQKWKKDFPEPDGRGRFGHVQQKMTFSCKATPADVDLDGIPNFDDEFPAEPKTSTVAVANVNAPAATATPAMTATPTPTPEPQPETPFLLIQAGEHE